MSEEKNVSGTPDDLAEVDNVEIAPLTDEDLDSASGGASISPLDGDCTSCVDTSGCCTSAA
jgi:hypothetical protein